MMAVRALKFLLTPKLKKLCADCIDWVVMNWVVMNRQAAKYILAKELAASVEQVEFLNPPVSYEKIYAGVLKSKPESIQLLQVFNNDLRILSDKGSLDKVMEKYQNFLLQ